MLNLKRECRAMALCALFAAALLLFFSRCSPIYPTNNWGEANAFFTVGRGMLAGKLPYRDLALRAGPVVYGLHALAACISRTSFMGVWLLEIAAMAVLLYFAWKAAVEISAMPVLSMGMAVLMGLLLVSSRAFVYGDTVEEFALPLQMFAVYDLLRYMKDPERKMAVCRLALHGFLAGCVFWLKYTLIGVHLAFIGVIAVDAMARERRLKGAAGMCMEFAAGGIFATAPWVLYFGLNGALKPFLKGYFIEDIEALIETRTPVRDALAALASGALHNPAAALALLCGGGYLLYRLVHRKWNGGCTAAAAAFVCAALIAYADGERYRFSPMAAGVFLMLCAGPLALLAAYAWRRRRAYAALLAVVALLCAGWNCRENESLSMIAYPKEELPQERFAQIISENGGGDLLTKGLPDGGFYLAAGELPGHAYFADSGVYGGYDAIEGQWEIADAQAAEWIVSSSSHAPNNGYERVAQASSPYDRSTDSKKGAHTYYLYRNKDNGENAEK